MSVLLITACQQDEAQRMYDNGINLWKEQKYDDAVQNFIALTKAYPNHRLVDDSLFWIANIFEHYQKEPEQAIRYYRSLNTMFESSEYNVPAMMGLARIRSTQGDEGKRKAIRIYVKLQKLPNPNLSKEDWERNQMSLAQLYYDLGNFEKARAELKRLIYERPESEFVAAAYYQIGRSYQEEGKLKLARLAFAEADERFGHERESISSALSLADIYEESGELVEAIRIYESILKRLEKGEIFYQLANNRIQKLRLRLKKTKTG